MCLQMSNDVTKSSILGTQKNVIKILLNNRDSKKKKKIIYFSTIKIYHSNIKLKQRICSCNWVVLLIYEKDELYFPTVVNNNLQLYLR